MIIKEARSAYYSKYKEFNNALTKIKEEQTNLQRKINVTPNGKELFQKEAATLELTAEALEQKQNEYLDYQSRIIEYETELANMETAKQQGEAMKEGAEEMGKIMEVARRMIKGDIVPAQDEKKLMEFDHELYMACKQMQSFAKEHEEVESLWEEKKESEENSDPMEFAENQEINISDGPSLDETAQDVIETIAG